MIKKIHEYRIHINAWVLFILYESIIVGVISGKFSEIGYYIGFYSLNITLFYFYANLLLPFALAQKKSIYWRLPGLILGTFFAYLLISVFLDFILNGIHHAQWKLSQKYSLLTLVKIVYRFTYFIGFGTGYFYLITYLKERKLLERQEKQRLLSIIENQSIQSELIKSQNALLYAQINPHFLFNTLNYIFTSTRKTAPEAAEAIMALSEIMRFAIDHGAHAEESEILLEIEPVENLIYLHQIRTRHQLNIKLDYVAGDLEGIKVIPLVIITLAENVFKHGELLNALYPAQISVYLEHAVLHVETFNLKGESNAISHHIGLENIRKRVDMMYGDHAIFEAYLDEVNLFHTHLRIQQLQIDEEV